MRIGLMGGTFDPVHIGHLIGAECAADQLALDQVVFVPAASPPHKGGLPISPAEHRVAMLEAAIDGNRRFALSLVEIERGGMSYTVDTVKAFRANLGQQAQIHFILGADNLTELTSWKNWPELCRECAIVALVRDGYPADRQNLSTELSGCPVVWVNMPLIGVSATKIRKACAAGASIRYLVPDAVAGYIARHKLYRAAGG